MYCLFTDIPITDTVQNVRTDKHNQSDIISKSFLLCISCKLELSHNWKVSSSVRL